MAEADIQTALSPEEWRLVFALREIPGATLRADVTRAMQEFVRFVAEPRCAQNQADGVPCETATSSCDRCRDVAGVLDRVRVEMSQ